MDKNLTFSFSKKQTEKLLRMVLYYQQNQDNIHNSQVGETEAHELSEILAKRLSGG